MGSSSKSSISNNISNLTVNKSDLEALNSNVNEFVSNSVIKNTDGCSAGSTQMSDNDLGDITVVGKKNTANIGVNSNQDSSVSLQCIQQSIQQTNINNDIATSIMQNLQQNVSNDQMTKMVNEAETNMKQGMAAGILNPFSSASSQVNMTLSNTQVTDTTRKLSNLISNKVANNQQVASVKDCFTKAAQQQNNRVGNVKILGDENTVNVNIQTNQVAKSFATCQQLTQQTATTTNDIATTLGLKIVDETENKTKSDSVGSSKTSLTQTGIEGIFAALSAFLAAPLISGIAIFLCVICCIISSVMYAKFSGSKSNSNSPKDDNPAGAGEGEGAGTA